MKEVRMKDSHWFMVLSKMSGWLFLLMFTLLVFYQVLPLILLGMGHLIFLFGVEGLERSVIDMSIYVLTGFSITSMLTYLLLQVERRIYRNMMTHSSEITGRIRKWYENR